MATQTEHHWTVEQAREHLEGLGFLVADQPQGLRRKHADLRVSCERNEYVVEASQRLPNGRWLALHEAVDGAGYRAIDRELRPLFAERIRESERQLTSTPAPEAAIRVGWFAAEADDDYVLACVEACLLGTRSVPMPESAAAAEIDCYGFAYSELSRCTDLDAAVLSNESGARLVLNPYGRAVEHVRRSSLYAAFAAYGAVVDPLREVEAGRALMVGPDFVGPRDGRAQWAYLAHKYGRPLATAC
ncbi:MAG: hypothetical protein EOP08_13650 [Proteobacteria bacterium]|nr:MAG: hypothetical protein EOP08_13650 [Pseudomonadota bacterium]